MPEILQLKCSWKCYLAISSQRISFPIEAVTVSLITRSMLSCDEMFSKGKPICLTQNAIIYRCIVFIQSVRGAFKVKLCCICLIVKYKLMKKMVKRAMRYYPGISPNTLITLIVQSYLVLSCFIYPLATSQPLRWVTSCAWSVERFLFVFVFACTIMIYKSYICI